MRAEFPQSSVNGLLPVGFPSSGPAGRLQSPR